MDFMPNYQYGNYVACTEITDEAKRLTRDDAHRVVPEEYRDQIKYFSSFYLDPETLKEVPCYCWKYTPKEEVIV
jgi:hypothetical protein